MIRHLDRLRESKAEWDDVLRESGSTSPLLSFDFVDLWYRSFAAPDEVAVVRAVDGTETVGFLPLVLRRRTGLRTLFSLTNSHCYHSDPPFRKGRDESFRRSILETLRREQTSWDLFRHDFSYSFSLLPGLIQDDELTLSGLPFRRTVHPTHTIRIDKPYERYFREDLSPNSRRDAARHVNRLTKAGSWSVRHLVDYDAVAQWPELLRLEDSGWKGTRGSSIARLASNYRAFYDGLIRLLASRGALHLFFLEFEGTAIAGDFGYVADGVFHWAKGGYDEAFGRFSPSNVLALRIIEEMTATHPEIRAIHLFPWDYGYKHRLCNETSLCLDTTVFGRTVPGEAIRLFEAAKDIIRPMIRRRAVR